MNDGELSGKVIGAAIEVHRAMGPGLLEGIYEECLACELALRGISYQRQFAAPLVYRGRQLGSDLRIDFLVEDQLVVELKAVEGILPVHEAQLLTYLRLTQRKLGLLINFNVPTLKDGIKRMANHL